MAADNKSLGRFSLNDIPPAPRGVPQIEVKFDIDANGIVHVSAKDLGTGKSQDITITGSSGFSDEEIDRMVKDAEQYKAEDQARKEKVEIRNQADAMVFQVEKALKDMGDNISQAEKDEINGAKDELAEALKGDDTDLIKAKSEALSEKLHKVTEKMYQQAQAAQQAAQGAQGGCDSNCTNCDSDDDNVVDADYKVVDDDENK